MKRSTYHAELIFNLNERLLINALEGVTDAQAITRISDHNNPLIWIVTHTVWARYNITRLLGIQSDMPYNELFENFKPFDSTMKFPSLADVKKEWVKVSAILRSAFDTVTEEHLAADSPLKTPIGDLTIGGTIAFLAEHESYDIGQIGFLKKYHTGQAMKYD